MPIDEKYKFIIPSEEDLPRIINLDICSLCQLNCAVCNIRKNEKKITSTIGGLGYIDFDTFKKFVDKNPYIEELRLSGIGEMFLNPDLDKIIKYSYEKNIALTAYGGVNMNYLSENMPETLVKYKFRGMNVAIDGATAETYAIYRKNGDFNKVIDNVKKINYYKEKYNSEYPQLIYQFIIFGHNEHEIEQAKELAKELNMEIYFVVNYDEDYSPIKDEERVKKLTGLTSLHSHLKEHYIEYVENKKDWCFCTDLFNSPRITSNGMLQGCCFAPTYIQFNINVFEEGLFNTLNNEKVLYAKQMLLDFSVQPRDDIPCSFCDAYRYMKKNNLQLF